MKRAAGILRAGKHVRGRRPALQSPWQQNNILGQRSFYQGEAAAANTGLPKLQRQQRRGFASASPGGGGGGGGLFDRVRETAKQEIENNEVLKERFEKLKEAEAKAGAALQTAQEKAGKLASEASEQAAKATGAFSGRFQEARERLKSFTGAGSSDEGKSPSGGEAGGEAKAGGETENDFVRASKEQKEPGYIAKLWERLTSVPLVATAMERTQGFREGLLDAAYDLVGAKASRRSSVVKRLPKAKPKTAAGEKKDGEAGAAEAATKEEEEEEPPRSGALVIVKSFGEAWEKLQARLKEAPIIQDILGAGRALGRTPVGQAAGKARQAVSDRVEDAQEAWETSQHPLVYRVSSAWDGLTAETEMGGALRELRRLDRSFDIEEWKADVQEALLPDVMSAFLRGEPAELREWMGEAVFNKLTADIEQRKKDGIVMDPHVLDIRQAEVLAIKADADSRNPTILLQFMCQQIHCVRNPKGEVLEGSEDDIRANYYIFAFQRDFLEQQHELRWKIVDFMLVGAYPYY